MNKCSYEKIFNKENKVMKKTFKLLDLDCAHCAAKIEDSVRKIEGVTSVEVNFLNQKMVLEADQERFQEIAEKAVTLIRKIEPDVTVKKI